MQVWISEIIIEPSWQREAEKRARLKAIAELKRKKKKRDSSASNISPTTCPCLAMSKCQSNSLRSWEQCSGPQKGKLFFWRALLCKRQWQFSCSLTDVVWSDALYHRATSWQGKEGIGFYTLFHLHSHAGIKYQLHLLTSVRSKIHYVQYRQI